jgi:hypothetical protein
MKNTAAISIIPSVKELKKITPVLLALLLCTGYCIGQEKSISDYREKAQFGLKAGGNYSGVTSSDGESFVPEGRLGIAAGAFVAIPLSKQFGIQPEVLFSQKGFHATGRLLNAGYELTRTTSYIDVPLLISYKPAEFLSFLAGPQYSYLIKQKDDFKNESTSIEQEVVFGNDKVRKHTLCLTAGADVNIQQLVLGVRVGIDMWKNNTQAMTTPNYRNTWVQATIGYRFYH